MVKTYNPAEVIVTFMGVPLTGFADGEFISITPSAERFTSVRGADGLVSRAKSNDNTHEVVLTLMGTSLSNNYLSGVLAADRYGNAGKGTLQIASLSGTDLFAWEEAWIRQPPDVSGDKTISDKAWTFDTGQAAIENYGGNI